MGTGNSQSFQLILPRQMVADIKVEAKQQGISVITLVRHAIDEYLGRRVRIKLGSDAIHLKLFKPDELPMTPAEIRYADKVMKQFREEDR